MKKLALLLVLVPAAYTYTHVTDISPCNCPTEESIRLCDCLPDCECEQKCNCKPSCNCDTEQDVQRAEDVVALYELCVNSPDSDTCHSIISKALDYKGLEGESLVDLETVSSETLCAVTEYLQSNLSEDAWNRVAALLIEQKLYCIE